MSQVVRVNATDRRIKYSSAYPNDDLTLFFYTATQFFFMFRGSIYA